MSKIHPLAFVSPNAKLGNNVEVGPFAFIDDNVVIGDNCKIHPHALIYSYVRMGNNCEVYPSAVVGGAPQDLKFAGEESYVEIGNNVVIRECVTINRGTKASGKALTKIGDNNLLMSYVHVAHDCQIGNNCILVSYSAIAGETIVDDWAILGGGTKAHQFSRVGMHAMVGALGKINKDIPPFVMVGRDPLIYAGLNLVGLSRRGFTAEQIENIKEIYNVIYYSSLNTSDACDKVEAEFAPSKERDIILDFIRNSKRGIVRAGNLSSKEQK